MANALLSETPIGRPDAAPIEAEIQALGRQLGRAGRGPRSLRRRAHERSMAAVAADPKLRAALFRLVDVAPACADSDELMAHLAAYLDDVEQPAPLVAFGSRTLERPALAPLSGRLATGLIRQMADRFIVGETIADAEPKLRRLWASGVATTVDLLGEATVSHAEGERYAARCEEALEQLAAVSAGWPSRPLLEVDGIGPLSRVNLSVKVTALTPLVRPEAPRRGLEDAKRQLRRLLRRAAELGAHLHVDMESMDSTELIVEMLLELLADPELAEGPSVGMVLQAYLRDSEALLDRVLEGVREAGRRTPLTIRLVKGAYWDHETIEAAQHGWAPPVWTAKAESDRCFERLTRRLVDAYPLVRPAIASHNLRSVAHAVAYARHAGLAAGDVEVQVLRGLGDELGEAVAGAGLRCRAYCPVGDMVAGMAYLVRRLLENTSNTSFLASQATGADLAELLRAP